jgi:O-antigen/teichoic acid export membrane protein
VSNPLKKLAGQTLIYGFSTMFPKFLSYFLTFALTYIFKEPADFAANPEIFSYIAFLNVIFTYGMETAFFHFSSKRENKEEVYSTVLISVLSSTLVLSLILFLLSPLFAEWLRYEDKISYIYWTILIVATEAVMAIPFAKLRLDNQPKKFAYIRAMNIIFNVSIVIFFLVFCKNAFEKGEDSFLANLYNPQIGIGYTFLANVLSNMFSILLLSKQFTGFQYTFNKELWREMMPYALPLLVLGLAGMVNEAFDRLIIKYLLPADIGEEAQGIYGACYKVAVLMAVFIQAFRYAAEPFFFNQSQDKNSKKTYALVMKYFVIFCSFLFLATTMNLPWIRSLVSENYRPGLGVVPILLLAQLFLGVYFNLSIWYKLTGKTRFGATITVIGAIVTLALNFAFVTKYSYMACAWATFAAYGVMMVISYFLGQKHFPVKYNLRSIFVFFFLSLGLYFLSFVWQGMENIYLKLILNNLLVLIFGWLFYKLEFSNLKNIKQQLQ